jgi:S-DNA-T family DNA segregation ATPase FtsK/SpoIIIE
VRLQGAFVSEEEVKQVVNFLKQKYRDEETPALEPEISLSEATSDWRPDLNFDEVSNEEDDEVLYEVARGLVIKAGKASASYLQRKLKIGYARAARLLDMLEERGIIGPADGARQRAVYEKPQTADLN